MKLTLKIKLLPDGKQSELLINTIKEANSVCNAISEIAYNKKIFNQFKIHHKCYHQFKKSSQLSAQILIRCIAKVSDSYKVSKKIKRKFRPLGGISYDRRVLNYKPNDIISIWCIGGRQKISFVCHNRKYIPYIKGEADLVYKKGKFFLMQTIEVSDEEIKDVEEFIGVDFGLIEIATTSDGTKYSSKELTAYRKQRQKVRSSIQSKGTKGAKKLLKRLSGKERTHGTIINHTISKAIVKQALSERKGIAIEDLKNIRFSSIKKGKKFRSAIGKWSFYQLRQFLEYKAKLASVLLTIVPPAYTSKTCSNCFNIGSRIRKQFTCNNCNSVFDADINAAINIALLGGSINNFEKSTMYCSIALHR